jgi:2-(1,2-epoxy-1,2-dihydrophenyl)acetyl-CoA isomerase
MHPDITVTEHDSVATLCIHRPPHNYFDPSLVRGLAGAALEISQTGDARCIVLCSEGRSFCAGANFGTSKGGRGKVEAEAEKARPSLRSGHMYEEAARLLDVEVPMIAAVQGAAIGGGLGLALLCDFRVAGPRARFVANFAGLGIHQGFGLSVTLPSVVGTQAASRMLLTAEEVSPHQALEMGLCDQLVAEEDLADAADRLARVIASQAPLAVRSIRRTLRGRLRADFLTAIDREINEQAWLFRTADHREALAALSDKRPPDFESR